MGNQLRSVRSWWRSQHILKRVVLGYVALIALPTVLVGIVANSWLTASVVGRASQTMTDIVEQWRRSIATATTQVETIGEVLQYNRSFTSYLAGDVEDRADQVIQYRQEVEPLLAFSRALSPYVGGIRIYARNEAAAAIGVDLAPWAALPRAIRKKAGEFGYVDEWRVMSLTTNEYDAVTPDTISTTYYRVIFDELLNRPVAVAEVIVDSQMLLEAIFGVVEHGTLALVAFRGDPEASPTLFIASASEDAGGVGNDSIVSVEAASVKLPSQVPSSTVVVGRTLLAAVDLSNPNLRLMLAAPKRVILRDLLPIRLLAALAAPVFGFLLSWVYYLVYYSWSRRIVNLTDHIRNTSHDQLHEFDEAPYEDEVGVLVHHYNELIARIRTLLSSLHVAEIRQREAAFRALLSQMNPHFLYNALESIRMMSEAGRNEDAAEMTYQLGKFSRYSLSDTSPTSTVRAEIEHARHFLAIHRRRMGDRLSYAVHMEPDTEAAICPRFIIQPIVENSIKHGIGMRRGGGEIRVTARGRGETLEIVIADDGTGMDGETLRCVQDHLESPSGRSAEPPLLHDDERGIGLANVHERLVSFGGAGSGLTVTSALGAGTKVTMQIRRSQ